MALLKTLIIVMGVLIVAGLAVVAVTITGRMGGAGPKAAKAGAGFGTVALAIGAGCSVVGTELAGDRLLVRTDGAAGCARIHIIDVTTGTGLGTLDITN